MATSEEDPAETERRHKRFGAQANNRAWALTVQPTRSAAEVREMLDAAHAAAWHWSKVGDELNRMRATMLLAEAHALAGLGTTAFAWGQEMRRFYLGRTTDDWEIALAHAVFADAAHAAGDAAAHREAYAQAADALGRVADAEDRRICAETFAHVPKP